MRVKAASAPVGDTGYGFRVLVRFHDDLWVSDRLSSPIAVRIRKCVYVRMCVCMYVHFYMCIYVAMDSDSR